VAEGGALGLVPGFGLAATFFAGLSREGGSFFAGLSPEGSFFAEPLPLRLGACDGRFFLEGGAGWACLGLSRPMPNKRCKKCKKPSLTVSPALIESRESEIDQRLTGHLWGSVKTPNALQSIHITSQGELHEPAGRGRGVDCLIENFEPDALASSATSVSGNSQGRHWSTHHVWASAPCGYQGAERWIDVFHPPLCR
jgi:hypothetical protein